jgi:RHS repeat-associated protein
MSFIADYRRQGLDPGADEARPRARRSHGRALRMMARGVPATLLVALAALPAQGAGTPSALAASTGTILSTLASHQPSLSERRALVRAQLSPARIAELSRHLRLSQGQERGAAASLRHARVLPHGTLRDGKTIVRDYPGRGTGKDVIQPAADPQASSSSLYYPDASDSWITDPAGGVTSAATACYYPASAGYYNEVPGCFGPTGDVYAGEQLTVTDEFWLSCNDTGVPGCGYPPETSQQVSVYFEVVCQPFNVSGVSDSTLLPAFGSQTVTASTIPDLGAPDDPVFAQATFTMPTTSSCPMGPDENGGFPNAYVQAFSTSDGNPDPNNSQCCTDSATTFFWENGAETGIAPPAQSNGAPCAQDSAGPGQSTAWGGDPVNTLEGECAESATDATVATPGYPLAIQRNYSAALNGTNGPLGPGWTMPWFASLAVDAATGNVTFNAENGNQYLYTSNGDGTFTPPNGATSVLAQLSSGDYTLTTRQQDVLTFSSSGQLLSEVDPTGRGLSLSYTGGNLTSVTDAAGQEVTLGYSGSLLTTITLPNGHTIAYAYTGGLLTSATVPGGPAGYETSYAYNSADLLTTITDANGSVTLRSAYNSAGQVTSQTDGTGAVTQFAYTTTSSGLAETDVTDPDGGLWTYLYGGNVLMEAIDPLGNETRYAYNDFLEPVEVTDPLGGFITMSYDTKGNLLTETDPLGNVQQWDYDGSNNLLSYTDGNGNTTTWTYNSMDEPTSMTDAEGNETTDAYSAAGELTTVVDPRGNVSGADAAGYTTSYAYNSAGQPTGVTDPDGGTTSYAYDSMGYLTSVTDPLGRVTSYSYDAGERLTGVTAADGGQTTYGYDGTGDLTSRTDADGNTWTYTYNADYELVKETDPLGASESYAYDGDGNQLAFTDADGAVTTTTYDADNRPVQVAYSDGTPTVTYAYDADGDMTTVTDGTGTRTLGYDADGELTTADGPGSASFSYAYDGDGNVLTRTYPDGTTTSYSYDADDQIASLTTGTATTTYSYDPAGDVTSVALPDGVTETGTYNGTGELTGLTYASGGTTLDSYGLTLDADGEPTQETVTQDGAAQPTDYYTYSSAGRLASACATSSGSSACSAASAGTATGAAPNPAAAGPPPTTVPTAPTGVTVTAGAGSATLAWTPPSTAGGPKLTGYTVRSSGGQTATAGPYATGATVSGLAAGTSYTFTITAASGAGSATTAATSAVTPGNETAYTYDQAGNLTSSETDGLTTTNTYNADEELTQSVTGSAAVSYAYDADGQQTTAGPDTYGYNAAGELSQAVTPAGTFGYGYDASGDLTATSLNGSLVQSTVWDLDNQLPQVAEETNSSGATTADYVYGEAGTLASMITPAGGYYPVSSSAGSITGLLDSGGAQVSDVSYSPYGTASQTSLVGGAPTSSIGYAGSYTMPGGTGLDDLRARDYSPATAGFTSSDPMALLTGQPYAYAGDDPVEFTDPSGLCSWYNLFCDVQQHWRGTLQVTAAVAGAAAVIVCTAATDGLCGVALELTASYELPVGSLLGAVGINEAEGAVDYAVSGGCHSWAGLEAEVGSHGLFGLGEGVLEEYVPLFQPDEGAHAVPVNWWHAWSQFNPF